MCDPDGVNIINNAYFGYKRVTAARSRKSINNFGLWGRRKSYIAQKPLGNNSDSIVYKNNFNRCDGNGWRRRADGVPG